MNDIKRFQPFDPLEAKYVVKGDVATRALKREINNILSSYVGWFDPFCELIQNSLDSLEERSFSEPEPYRPSIWITINIKENHIIVTDNGTGLDEQKFKAFLAPDFSFKSGNTRGHKGVGATYLAYGFNHMQVCTKTGDFTAIGKMINARKWLSDENPAGNPVVSFDVAGPKDNIFNQIDKGVSFFLLFDKYTHPKKLSWIKANSADAWLKILSAKTGLGAFHKNKRINVEVRVIGKDGNISEVTQEGVNYLWPHSVVKKRAAFKEIMSKRDSLYKKGKDPKDLPSSYKNLDMLFELFSTSDILEMSKSNILKLTEEEMEILKKYTPSLYFGYTYSVKLWKSFNESLNVRENYKVLYGGIQIFADNMPQGEIIQIPLNRNIGRQNQVHVAIHFDKCSADLGRKGFQSEIVEFTKEISKQLIDGPLQILKFTLKTNTGAAPDIFRETEVENWKKQMVDYETKNPLDLFNEHFFLPLRKISITSIPTREQDVIALFNQLLAGGIIRGLRIMATNERLTYDGLYRIVIEEPDENHLFNKEKNPLGILQETLEVFKKRQLPFISRPMVLEYKYSLDGLIENIEDGSKNSNDIGLVIVWETGDNYLGSYKITSLLDADNVSSRQYHGVTHVMTNLNTDQREMDLIVLSELISYLNDPIEAQLKQKKKYDD